MAQEKISSILDNSVNRFFFFDKFQDKYDFRLVLSTSNSLRRAPALNSFVEEIRVKTDPTTNTEFLEILPESSKRYPFNVVSITICCGSITVVGCWLLLWLSVVINIVVS